MVNVPSAYAGLVSQMSSATGLPQSVIAAQANEESGFNATAVSPAGAEGWLQFLPSTYNSYTTQAGVAPGTEFNPADESKVYDVFMSALLQQEGGNVRNALAAYNAGPGNLSAGYGYADTILSAAGTGDINVTSSGGTSNPSTAGITIPGLGGSLSVSGVVSDAMNAFLKAIGISSFKDMFERFGLIVLGFTLVIVGIHILSTGTGKQAINIQTSTNDSGSTRTVRTPVSRHTRTTTKAAEGTGASEALEAAAVA